MSYRDAARSPTTASARSRHTGVSAAERTNGRHDSDDPRRPPASPASIATRALDLARRAVAVRVRPRGQVAPSRRHRSLAAHDSRAVCAREPHERHRRHWIPPGLLVRARVRPAPVAAERAAAAAFRRGGLPGAGLGQRTARVRARGRSRPFRDRHHARAHPGRPAARDGAGLRRSRRPREAARQAGLETRAARDLVSTDQRHLADGLAGAGFRPVPARDQVDAEPRALGSHLSHLRRGRPRRRVGRSAALARRQQGADRRRLPRGARRGPPQAGSFRSRHRRFPQRDPLVARATDAAAGRDRTGLRRRSHRPGDFVHRAAQFRRAAGPPDAERPSLPVADGARPGLLARQPDDCTRSRRAAPRRRTRQGHGLQRSAQAPEDRGSALPVLGGRARAPGLGGDAERVSLHATYGAAAGARMDRCRPA